MLSIEEGLATEPDKIISNEWQVKAHCQENHSGTLEKHDHISDVTCRREGGGKKITHIAITFLTQHSEGRNRAIEGVLRNRKNDWSSKSDYESEREIERTVFTHLSETNECGDTAHSQWWSELRSPSKSQRERAESLS